MEVFSTFVGRLKIIKKKVMKKIWSIVLVIAALFVAIPSQAQFQWGVRGGVNLAKASFSGASVNGDNYTGFFIGPTAEFTIPLIGLGVDGSLLYSQTGIKGEGETLKRRSIEIPVNLKYNIGLGSLLGVYVAAGPQFGFGLNDDEIDLGEGGTFSFKKSNLSVNVGAGVKLIHHLQLGFNYNIPIGKTAECDGLVDAGEKAFSAKVKTWQVSVAYMF